MLESLNSDLNPLRSVYGHNNIRLQRQSDKNYNYAAPLHHQN